MGSPKSGVEWAALVGCVVVILAAMSIPVAVHASGSSVEESVDSSLSAEAGTTPALLPEPAVRMVFALAMSIAGFNAGKRVKLKEACLVTCINSPPKNINHSLYRVQCHGSVAVSRLWGESDRLDLLPLQRCKRTMASELRTIRD